MSPSLIGSHLRLAEAIKRAFRDLKNPQRADELHFLKLAHTMPKLHTLFTKLAYGDKGVVVEAAKLLHDESAQQHRAEILAALDVVAKYAPEEARFLIESSFYAAGSDPRTRLKLLELGIRHRMLDKQGIGKQFAELIDRSTPEEWQYDVRPAHNEMLKRLKGEEEQHRVDYLTRAAEAARTGLAIPPYQPKYPNLGFYIAFTHGFASENPNFSGSKTT